MGSDKLGIALVFLLQGSIALVDLLDFRHHVVHKPDVFLCLCNIGRLKAFLSEVLFYLVEKGDIIVIVLVDIIGQFIRKCALLILQLAL